MKLKMSFIQQLSGQENGKMGTQQFSDQFLIDLRPEMCIEEERNGGVVQADKGISVEVFSEPEFCLFFGSFMTPSVVIKVILKRFEVSWRPVPWLSWSIIECFNWILVGRELLTKCQTVLRNKQSYSWVGLQPGLMGPLWDSGFLGEGQRMD